MQPEIKRHGDAPQNAATLPPDNARFTRQWSHSWSTPEAFARFCSTVPRGWNDNHGEDNAHREDDFSKTRNMAHAVDLAIKGWPQGAARATALRDRINATHPTGPRLVKYDVAGAAPHIARALSGNPMNMRVVDSVRLRRRPVMTLVSDITQAAFIPSECMEHRAAVVAAVVDAIETEGYSVELMVTAASGNDDLLARCTIGLKDAGEQADMNKLAFGLGHPGIFRRMMFSAVYGNDEYTRDLGFGLGQPQETKPNADLNANGVYIIPSAQSCYSKFHTEDVAATQGLAHIISALKAQGCPAFADYEAPPEITEAPYSPPYVPPYRPKHRRRRRWR